MAHVDTAHAVDQASPGNRFVKGRFMDFETVSAEEFGASLRGIGLNLLTRDVPALCAFLETVFLAKAHRVTQDFAIISYADQIFQLHADGTYHSHPLLGLLPENPPRGVGIEIRLYNTDPDHASLRAETYGAHIVQPPTNKPHGLRECYIMCENGYVWVASRPLERDERG